MTRKLSAILITFGLIGCSSDSATNTVDEGTTSIGINVPASEVLDSNSISVSSTSFSVNAASVDGNTTTITFRTANNDNNNNAVDDGLQVRFVTEGGSITDSCFLENGACQVTWTGQNPRPADYRSTILAYTLGTETFLDNNANGLFDDGDLFNDITSRGDVPEPFVDYDEDEVYDAGLEPFVDNLSSGTSNTYDGGDGLFSGSQCAHSTLCASHESLYIFQNITIVMSEGQERPLIDQIMPTTLALTDGNTQSLEFRLRDTNDNALPSNTPINITIDDSIGTVFSGASQVFPATELGPFTFTASFTGAEYDPLDPPPPGQVTITVEMEGISYLYVVPATLSP